MTLEWFTSRKGRKILRFLPHEDWRSIEITDEKQATYLYENQKHGHRYADKDFIVV